MSSAIKGEDVSGAVAGPVGIASLTYQATQLGFVYVIQFAALLSLNLAIFNLLPFPPLDGGKLIFVVLEAIVRRPVPLRWQVIVHNVGFVIFLIFIMAVTIKDVIGLVS
ncbi:MAG: RIP metalloprotease RseP [uncultured bacterium]|nr:MAG: RIP metalloprotease RseP [uncultured bacterium]